LRPAQIQPTGPRVGAQNNRALEEIDGLAPGTALDLGCGEGADAIWLAERGWQVTAADISQAALDRAAGNRSEAARQLGVGSGTEASAATR